MYICFSLRYVYVSQRLYIDSKELIYGWRKDYLWLVIPIISNRAKILCGVNVISHRVEQIIFLGSN